MDLRDAFVRCLTRIYPSGHFQLPRIKGLTSAAKELGVTRTHLSLVLHGHRKSESLSAGYAKLSSNS